MFFPNAVSRLSLAGCDVGYASSAVADEHGRLESAVHELAHAVVLRMPLDPNPTPLTFGKLNIGSLTQQIGKHISDMRKVDQDRNEEITLAVEMCLLEDLGIQYVHDEFVTGVDWKTSNRDHDQNIREAMHRPTTRKHAKRILNYLKRIDRLPPIELTQR